MNYWWSTATCSIGFGISIRTNVLIIDEPTSQLDPQETERVFDIIKKMKNMGKTILLVEHKIELVAEYSDDILVLENGKLIRFGEEHDVLSEIELQNHGVMLPQTVILADKMRKKGLNLKEKIITSDEIVKELKHN